MRRWLSWTKRGLLVAVIAACGQFSTAFAVTSSSTHYQVTETEFGAASGNDSCSTGLCARTSIGDTGNGTATAGGHTAQFGSITEDEPSLDVIVDPGVSNLGVLDTEHTATKTTTIKIRNYLSNGYLLQITGDPPKYAGHLLATPSTPTAAAAGTEQFGINAVANTSPALGADPVQVPSGKFSFGLVNDNYAMANKFMYQSGDVVAHSATASGETDYTISMIVNVSNATPAGHYSGDFAAVVIPVY